MIKGKTQITFITKIPNIFFQCRYSAQKGIYFVAQTLKYNYMNSLNYFLIQKHRPLPFIDSYLERCSTSQVGHYFKNNKTPFALNTFENFRSTLKADEYSITTRLIKEDYIYKSSDYYDDDDYGSSYEEYGGYNGYSDDVINDAFEGDPTNTWNID